MICQIEIPHKAYSINALYYRDGKRKRAEAVQWERTISEYLRDDNMQLELSKIRENFDHKKHSINVELIYEYPHEILYTKSGALSSRAFDLSNVEKTLIDVLFLPKYSLEACRNLEIDDKYITKLTSSKISSQQHSIKISIELLPLPNLQTKTNNPLKNALNQEDQDHQDIKQL